MAKSEIRFQPPRIEVFPEVDLLLHLAFGDTEVSQGPTDLDQGRFLDLGERLGLLSRIRSRVGPDVLKESLSAEVLAELHRVHHRTIAAAMVHEEVCSDLASVAEKRGQPIVFLKGMALHLQSLVPVGARPVVDIDVLVSKDEASALFEHLAGLGWVEHDLPSPDYHLPPIWHPLGSAIEIHHELDGVRIAGETRAGLDVCLEEGLCSPVPGMPAAGLVPSESLLLAHLIAHGLGTHGKSPELYPGFRLMADLQDLGYSPAGGKRLPPQVEGWVRGSVNSVEVAATLEILARFEAGERASDIARSDRGSAVLLRHLLAGHLDEAYARSLKLVRRVEAPEQGSWVVKLFKSGWRALWLTPVQIDLLYGRPRSRLGYIGWQVWRPFDLAHKSLRALLAHWKVMNRSK